MPGTAWLVLRRGEREVLQLRGPVLELMTESRARLHRRLSMLGLERSARDGHQTRFEQIYGTAGRPCPRCGERIRSRGQGDDNRITYWCPACQR